jgi:hypothetical protein
MTGFPVRRKKTRVPEWSFGSAGDDLTLPAVPPLDDRADCCCAAAAVRVRLPKTAPTRSRAELLLCGHHYREHSAALTGAGAEAYDAGGQPLWLSVCDALAPAVAAGS